MLINNEETRNTLIGALVVGALSAAMALSYGGKTLSAKAQVGSYQVEAVFNQVDGLFTGDDVRMSGIRVGTVGPQVLDTNFRVHMSLLIDNGIELPLDTSAAIHTDGLFGAKFVVLEPGGELDAIQPGGSIDYTQDAVIVSELLELIIAEGHQKMNRTDASPQGGQ